MPRLLLLSDLSHVEPLREHCLPQPWCEQSVLWRGAYLGMAFCIDPVCGRRVEQSKAGVEALMSQHHGRTYYFCSMACKQEFDRNPHAHAMAKDPICGNEVDREQAE